MPNDEQPNNGPERPDFGVKFGAEAWLGQCGHLVTAVGELPLADFELPWEEVCDRTPDYLAPVTIVVDGDLAFTGNVIRATPLAGRIKVECKGGVAMTEVPMGDGGAEEFPPLDLIYAAARGAGLDEEHINIQGLDSLPLEPLEVVIALEGVEMSSSVGLGGISLMAPVEIVDSVIDRFGAPPDPLVQAFREADCVAVVTRSGRRMWDAEQTALHQARLCLAWLATRGRFGHATDAYGAATRFERRVSRTLPRIGRAVAVRGLRTRRRWILQPEEPTSRPALNAGDARQLLRPPLPEELSQSTDMAMRRAMRAYAGDPAERVLALFEAWEFYSAAVPPSRAFSPDDLRRLREELPGCLPTWVQPTRLSGSLTCSTWPTASRFVISGMRCFGKTAFRCLRKNCEYSAGSARLETS